MTASEIIDLINTALPIGITVGQLIAHTINGTRPDTTTPEEWDAITQAALNDADATDEATLTDIDQDQAANAPKPPAGS